MGNSAIMDTWRGIDSYMQQVDQYLCSNECPCTFTSDAALAYSTNATLSPYYNRWVSVNIKPGNTRWENCPARIKDLAMREAQSNNPLFNPNNDFDQADFSTYMNNVEREFGCTGWCNVTYVNPQTNQINVMYKYLFSDINLGPPKTVGCLNPIINYLPPYLLAFGSVAMVLVGFQLLTLIMAICQCLAREKDHEHQIPHHHDDNRVVA